MDLQGNPTRGYHDQAQAAAKIDPHLPYIIHKLPHHLSKATTKGDKLD
jgi:hypothetical protein